MPSLRPGSIGWIDLTVADAPRLRDFYREVGGFEISEVEMGGYSDFCLHPPGGGDPVAGVCHARGGNAGLPPVWMVYFVIADLDLALAACTRLGGELVAGPKGAGPSGRFAVVRDPEGVAFALFESKPT